MTTPAPNVARDLLAITPTDVKTMSRQQKLALLRDIQTQQQRCPALVLRLCTDLLKGNASSLGDDLYSIHEQSLIASLDCGNIDLALQHHAFLSAKFGKKSVRVRKLAGMIQEAAGRNDSAINTYTALLRDSLGDAFVVKRLSAMKKSVGDIAGAIEILEDYQAYTDEEQRALTFHDLHPGDLSALRELAALHVRQWNLDRALFYTEEVMMLEPPLYLNHVRVAEVCYALGRLDHAAVAYSHSLRLNDGANSARALYGLWLVTHELKKGAAAKRGAGAASDVQVSAENATDLHAWATTKLRALYTGSPNAAALDLILSKQS